MMRSIIRILILGGRLFTVGCNWREFRGGGMYSGSTIIIKIYPACSLAIGGRDGMDCSRRLQMTCSINRIRHQSWRLGIVFVVGDVG